MNHKYIERCDEEQNQRISRQSICQALAAGCLAEFLHGEGPDVPGTALVQITGGPVMQCVLPSPMHIGGQVEKPRDGARHVVGPLGIEKRRVATVVEDDEYPRKKAG